MRISTEWLNEYVATPPAAELGHVFEMAGIGVEEEHDGVFQLEITSNRGDWLSATGLAREIGAMTDKPVQLPATATALLEAEPGPLRVTIGEPDDCPRYIGVLIDNIVLGESPDWMQRRLTACGMRPINNIVDVTNYVMLETGQPLHAFDADLVHDQHILVRRAKPGEELATLDETVRELDADMLVIAHSERALAIAGIMGGRDSEVGSGTRRILLEAAHFAPERVQYAARRLNLTTEASRRFERWVDPNGTARAAARAVELLHQYAQGKPVGGAVDNYPAPIAPTAATMRPARCNGLLGLQLQATAMGELLQRLGLNIGTLSETSIDVTVPTWRQDITREVDLIEEVARLHGYDNVPATLPRGANPGAGRSLQQRLEERTRQALLRCGLQEVVSVTLENAAEVARASLDPAQATTPVALRNPVTEDFTQLRTSLLPSLLRTLEHNARRATVVFEAGKVYLPTTTAKQPHEERWIGIALLDAPPPPHWQGAGRAIDFYLLKAMVEHVCAAVGAPAASFVAQRIDPFHPGRGAAAQINGQEVARLGEIHPAVAGRFDLKHRAYAALINFDALVRHSALVRQYVPLPRFPAAERDLAVIVPRTVAAATVQQTIKGAAGPAIEAVTLFDVYTGRPIPEDSVSLTFALRFRAADRTLTDDEVQAATQAIVGSLQSQLGARLRD